jgi:hypothetical protein
MDGLKKPVEFLGKLKPNKQKIDAIAKKVLLQRQSEALVKMSKERIQCLKNFAEQNVMESRKLMQMKIPNNKADITASTRRKIREAYKHPFEKIPEEVYMKDIE